MNRNMLRVCSVLAAGSFAVSGVFPAFANAEECKVPPVQHSKEFERLKGLEGKWHGESQMNGQPGEIDVTYHVTSGGTAVVETLSPGTPHEMVSVYHDDHAKLKMTHYCMIGNQPKLDLTSSSPTSMDFTFGKGNTFDPKKEMHMDSLHVAFIDNDHIVQTWGNSAGGKAGGPAVFKLSRVTP